ncbi:hypothetical protein G5I_03618 [Acromyrmex echinatior]|uniref:Uncharacterized protein n=1 Tax=Acromyrmex echinatior TaxID=103372 RepID=F4WDG5_ACREC|nr:hypothetical protein G5I_03618 [Acromyrmex echinatior]
MQTQKDLESTPGKLNNSTQENLKKRRFTLQVISSNIMECAAIEGCCTSSGSQRDPLADSREKSQRIQLPGCTVVGIAEEARADEGTEINTVVDLWIRGDHVDVGTNIEQDDGINGPKTTTPIDCRSCNVLAFSDLQDLT